MSEQVVHAPSTVLSVGDEQALAKALLAEAVSYYRLARANDETDLLPRDAWFMWATSWNDKASLHAAIQAYAEALHPELRLAEAGVAK